RNGNDADSITRCRSMRRPIFAPSAEMAAASAVANDAGAKKAWCDPALNSAFSRSPIDSGSSSMSAPDTPWARSPRPAPKPATKARTILSPPSMISSCQSAIVRPSPEEDPSCEQEDGDEEGNAVAKDVAKERRHRHSRFLGDRFHHEIGRIPDVRVRTHEHGTRGDRLQEGVVLGDQAVDRLAFGDARIKASERGRQEREIRRRVVQERRQSAARPEEMSWLSHRADHEGERTTFPGAQH